LRPPSFHSVERLLKEFQITRIPNLLACLIDPLLFQGILGRTIAFVEDARERELGQLIRGELVGDVVEEFVLGSVVPFFLVDQREGAAFARIGGIEGVGEKFDAFTEAFDDGGERRIGGQATNLDKSPLTN
jgi:hypothetical protein